MGDISSLLLSLSNILISKVWGVAKYTTQPKVYRSENESLAQNACIKSVKWSVSEFIFDI